MKTKYDNLDKIEALKLFRANTGLSLKESLDLIKKFNFNYKKAMLEFYNTSLTDNLSKIKPLGIKNLISDINNVMQSLSSFKAQMKTQLRLIELLDKKINGGI